jgi:hypothetical protein
MSLTPRKTLSDDYIHGLSCAICGNPNLAITHVEKYPDFVSCDRCGSAFVVENEGSWVMYGKIPAEYPETQKFALRQWTWLDAVAQRAADEREMRSTPSPTEEKTPEEFKETTVPEADGAPPIVQELGREQEEQIQVPESPEIDTTESEPLEEVEKLSAFTMEVESRQEEQFVPISPEESEKPIFEQISDLDEIIAPTPFEPVEVPEEKPEIPPETMEMEPDFTDVDQFLEEALRETTKVTPESISSPPDEIPLQPKIVTPTLEEEAPPEVTDASRSTPLQVAVGEPEPDKRFRIRIRGAKPKYPKNYCAHCLRTPVKEKAIMRGSLPDPNRPGQRKLVPLNLPFCTDCQKRMNARGDDEKNARMIIFLVSGLIAVIAIVGLLAFGLIDFGENAVAGVIILLTAAVLGFSIPLLIGLNWANRYPPPRDAAFVLSTLLVHESGEDLTEFEWRNPGYAELFRQVNIDNVVGDVEPIEDQAIFIEPQPVDIPSETQHEATSEVPKEPVDEEPTTP